jgi:tRNA C32,U32 (ribose-2'-O)-methylase TrmJ
VWVTDLSKTAICLDEKVQIDIPKKVALGTDDRLLSSRVRDPSRGPARHLTQQHRRARMRAVIGREADGCSQEMLAAADMRYVSVAPPDAYIESSHRVQWLKTHTRSLARMQQGLLADVRIL